MAGEGADSAVWLGALADLGRQELRGRPILAPGLGKSDGKPGRTGWNSSHPCGAGLGSDLLAYLAGCQGFTIMRLSA